MVSWFSAPVIPPEVLAKMQERLPPTLMAQANSDSKLLKRVAELAQAKERPQDLGTLGKIGKALQNAFTGSLLNSVVFGAVTAGIIAGGDAVGLGEWVGTKPDKAEVARAGDDPKKLAEMNRPAGEFALRRAGMMAGLSMGAGTLLGTINGFQTVESERKLEQYLWDMLHGKAAPQVARQHMVAAHTAPDIQAPRNIPHLSGIPAQGAYNIG